MKRTHCTPNLSKLRTLTFLSSHFWLSDIPNQKVAPKLKEIFILSFSIPSFLPLQTKCFFVFSYFYCNPPDLFTTRDENTLASERIKIETKVCLKIKNESKDLFLLKIAELVKCIGVWENKLFL